MTGLEAFNNKFRTKKYPKCDITNNECDCDEQINTSMLKHTKGPKIYCGLLCINV